VSADGIGTPTDDMDKPENHVLIALRRIIRATDLHSRALDRQTGLTTPQLMVIRAVKELQQPTVTAIASSVSLSQATVTIILNRLESKRLVRRERSNSDRRARLIHLTAAGTKLWKSAPQPLQDSFTERFRALPERNRKQIVHALEQVADMMDARQLDAAPLLASGEHFH
jgi:DNA-binding MarR family transcriptional regulator